MEEHLKYMIKQSFSVFKDLSSQEFMSCLDKSSVAGTVLVGKMSIVSAGLYDAIMEENTLSVLKALKTIEKIAVLAEQVDFNCVDFEYITYCVKNGTEFDANIAIGQRTGEK